MIHIHWQLIPLILLILIVIINTIFGQNEEITLMGIIEALLGLFCIGWYLILGLVWLFSNIRII